MEIYTAPSPPPLTVSVAEQDKVEETDIIQETIKEEPEEKQKEAIDSGSQGDSEETLSKEEGTVSGDLVKPTRPIHSRPTSSMEVFDHMVPGVSPTREEKLPTKKPSVLSRAMSILRQKSPPPDSIRSSVLGLYGAQASMMAAAILGKTQW